MPKWLFDILLRTLLPFDDSRQACAILMLAGIPLRFISSMAKIWKRSIYSLRVVCDTAAETEKMEIIAKRKYLM
jgi:hypothetical protein